ncbi:phage baseplate protein [Paraburkholderia phytofirmans OLGA172]|uniref:Phage baseplate protein n=1 Tax=Paraburkholderia phytofirmans OLGA172 TaxID=1417228 RepID=A0A167VVE2_9BURK|nr:GPW/gp25 family protein [Paraburkholderia phytofirmans]ANB72007.1 phage baseplate protein [Paraburkholderia phytofirmans OLGA172]
MANDILTQTFGRGWAFPVAFTLADGVVMAEGAQDVNQSLRILFSTEPGERVMRENYGCALYDVMFENIDGNLIAEIETRIIDGMLRYEPRAHLTAVRVYQPDAALNQLQVEVTYCLRGSDIEQKIAGLLDVGDAQGRWMA